MSGGVLVNKCESFKVARRKKVLTCSKWVVRMLISIHSPFYISQKWALKLKNFLVHSLWWYEPHFYVKTFGWVLWELEVLLVLDRQGKYKEDEGTWENMLIKSLVLILLMTQFQTIKKERESEMRKGNSKEQGKIFF